MKSLSALSISFSLVILDAWWTTTTIAISYKNRRTGSSMYFSFSEIMNSIMGLLQRASRRLDNSNENLL
jgi:hypothetical protein